ncbi:MAG: hypothetical protein CVU59_08760 [Deltaproteobacteria bacterium HGW-Deltaproteobacteria-17]|nr:MAG: hypothetical protein CVU59_08760 [Deltaproteobacteria bacterium HGW-Deltaproteobacteria-17]
MSFGMSACDDGGGKKTTAEICNDAKDNDGDGRVDCYDTDCATDAACNTNNNDVEICSNGTDDDGDGLVDCLDTADCATAANCQATQENCTNGQDDDGDGAVDCNDTDCATAANCQTGSCTIDNIFFDSPQTCDTGFICSINESMQPACLPEANFAGGTFYGDCGANGECPKGSGCFNDGTNNLCMPFCTDAHTTCPAGGACIYGVQGSDVLFLCGPTDDCDPVTGTGCPTQGDGCYLAGGDGSGLCVAAGTAATGEACTSLDSCLPGHICADAGSGNQCIALCSNTVTCTAGSCQSIGQNGLPAGIGVCL